MKKTIITLILLFTTLVGYSQLNNNRYLKAYTYHELINLPHMIVDQYADVDTFKVLGKSKDHFIFIFTKKNDLKDIFVFSFSEMSFTRRNKVLYDHIYPSSIDRDRMFEMEKKTGVLTTYTKYGLPIYYDDNTRSIDSIGFNNNRYYFYMNDSSKIYIDLNKEDGYRLQFKDDKMGVYNQKL